MGLPVVPAISPFYNVFKDVFLYLRAKKELIDELNLNLTALMLDLITIRSRISLHAQKIEESPFKLEKNEEYISLEGLAEYVEKQFKDCYAKYRGVCELPDLTITNNEDLTSSSISTSQQSNSSRALSDHIIHNDDFTIIDNETMNKIICSIRDRKFNKYSWKFIKLGRFARNVARLRKFTAQLVSGLGQDTEKLLLRRSVDIVQLQHGEDDSRHHNILVDRVLMLVQEKVANRILLVGPMGVGKTAVLRHVNNKLRDMPTSSNRSNIVIWLEFTEVAGENTVQRMQDDILDRINRSEDKSQARSQKANIISSYLSERNYLVIIDNVTEAVDLDRVGVYRSHHKGTVIIAAEFKDVIDKMPEFTTIIEVNKLSLDETVKLFMDNYGELTFEQEITVHRSYMFLDGMPRRILSMAAYLKINESVWPDVVGYPILVPGLQESSVHYMSVYEGLSMHMKKCLTYCALLPYGYEIHKDLLAECWKADPSLRSSDVHENAVLAELTNKYLLEWSSDHHVVMPALLRRALLEREELP